MAAYPPGFLPDLRHLRAWPNPTGGLLTGSLWRSPALARLTYGELAHLVKRSIGPSPARVLYVGSGLGHTALELARAGHDVTGVEIDAESVALATRAADADPLRDRRGPLSYEVAEFPDGFQADGPYDQILFSRVLHHIPDPARAVERADDLLSPGGRVVCVEFAHDRLGTPGAEWMAHWRTWLSRAGWWAEPVADSLPEEAERVAADWRKDHEEEGLNPLGAMLDPLRSRFRVRELSWHPYLFWDLAAEMVLPAEREEPVARELRDDEVRALREDRVRGVLFSTTGTVRTR
jgi:2-polyprenyl-3-methyl-5-hydroxy-6-metoxy-1,4-benzoquinol methylase